MAIVRYGNPLATLAKGEVMINPMERIIHLKKIPLFTDLQVQELTAIASIARERSFVRGEVIIQEGDVGESLYMILDGKVSVIKGRGTPSEFGLAEIGPDDYFGEIALFDREPRSATVVAEEDTDVLELSQFEFEEIMKEFPQIAIHACYVFTQRLRALQTKWDGV
jgi:CRP-like cAMP-binding protein